MIEARGHDQYIPVAATSSGAWAVNALTNLAKTGQDVYNCQGSTLVDTAQASGALLNLGAAAAAGASAYYMKVGNPAAAPAGFASGLLWGAGVLAQGAGAWLDQRPSAESRLSDLMRSRPDLCQALLGEPNIGLLELAPFEAVNFERKASNRF